MLHVAAATSPRCCLGVAWLTNPFQLLHTVHCMRKPADSPHLMILLTNTLSVLQPYVDLRTGELMAEVRCVPCYVALACLAGRKDAPGLHKQSARRTTCTFIFTPPLPTPGTCPRLHIPCKHPCLQTAASLA